MYINYGFEIITFGITFWPLVGHYYGEWVCVVVVVVGWGWGNVRSLQGIQADRRRCFYKFFAFGTDTFSATATDRVLSKSPVPPNSHNLNSL